MQLQRELKELCEIFNLEQSMQEILERFSNLIDSLQLQLTSVSFSRPEDRAHLLSQLQSLLDTITDTNKSLQMGTDEASQEYDRASQELLELQDKSRLIKKLARKLEQACLKK
ncbi:hypothetical protein Ciccas_010734 [Cichlidogyrus casuarinus]|uniref:Uncharacterized protein n=1 Tax=Cichlidogyrus casuarinus TaxID=1844966 RepID=A0ABD2PT93_9PLAT